MRSTASGKLQCCCPPGSPAAKAPPTKYDLGQHPDAEEARSPCSTFVCATAQLPASIRVNGKKDDAMSRSFRNPHHIHIKRHRKHSSALQVNQRSRELYRSAEGGSCMPSLDDSHAALPSRPLPESYSSTRLMKESLRAISVRSPSLVFIPFDCSTSQQTASPTSCKTWPSPTQGVPRWITQSHSVIMCEASSSLTTCTRVCARPLSTRARPAFSRDQGLLQGGLGCEMPAARAPAAACLQPPQNWLRCRTCADAPPAFCLRGNTCLWLGESPFQSAWTPVDVVIACSNIQALRESLRTVGSTWRAVRKAMHMDAL